MQTFFEIWQHILVSATELVDFDIEAQEFRYYIITKIYRELFVTLLCDTS